MNSKLTIWLRAFIIVVSIAGAHATQAPEADAQILRRRRAPSHHVPVVQEVFVVDTPDVYVVQNNSPAPLVSQGNTQYASSYQQAVFPLLDPNRYFSQELELLKAADQTQALRSERASKLFQRVAEIQAPAAESLARGQAASQVLRAVGLDEKSQARSSTVVISRDRDGRLQVVELDPSVASGLTVKPEGLNVLSSQTASPNLRRYCASCHGTDLASPKGGFYLGDTDAISRVMRREFFTITQKIASGAMPPASSNVQPTKEERAAILNEIQSIILRRKEE